MVNNKCRIMVIDDEPIVGRRLKQIFEKAGYDVAAFTNGGPALQELEINTYDIIVTDLKMEDISGMQELDAAREKNPRIKVIIMTAFAEMETAKEAFRKGVFDFIAKPVQIDDLKQVIMNAEKEIAESK